MHLCYPIFTQKKKKSPQKQKQKKKAPLASHLAVLREFCLWLLWTKNKVSEFHCSSSGGSLEPMTKPALREFAERSSTTFPNQVHLGSCSVYRYLSSKSQRRRDTWRRNGSQCQGCFLARAEVWWLSELLPPWWQNIIHVLPAASSDRLSPA